MFSVRDHGPSQCGPDRLNYRHFSEAGSEATRRDSLVTFECAEQV